MSLDLFPVAVRKNALLVQVTQPVTYNLMDPVSMERRRGANKLASIIGEM